MIDKPFLPEDILWRQNLRKIPGAYTFNDMTRALLKPNAMRSTAVTYLEFKETEEVKVFFILIRVHLLT